MKSIIKNEKNLSSFLRRNAAKLTILLIIIVTILYVGVPLYEMIVNSLKYKIDTVAIPKVLIPTRLTFENYKTVFEMPNFWLYFSNTLIVSSVTVVFVLLLGLPAAFILVRANFPMKLNNFLIYWILLTRMIPMMTTMMPLYLTMRNFGLLDTRTGLVIVNVGANLPFVIWILMGIIKALPIELEEAARLDGANTFDILTRIIAPLSVPALVSAGTLIFIFVWNDFVFPLFLTTQNAKTLALVLPGFLSDREVLWGPMNAMSSIIVIPVLIIVLIFQKYLVRGLTVGAIK